MSDDDMQRFILLLLDLQPVEPITLRKKQPTGCTEHAEYMDVPVVRTLPLGQIKRTIPDLDLCH